jgi:methylmalonyl-CoA mutase cobalamin-binding domain/chain
MLQKLAPQTTALVLVDLQQGILGFAKAPRSAESVLAVSAKLAKRFREIGAPVVLVRVGGIIPDQDIENLKKIGVAGIFQPGTPMDNIVQFIREHVKPQSAPVV